MLNTAIALLALTVIGGLYLATRHLRQNPPPIAVALIHGVVAVTALGLILRLVLAGGEVGRLPLALGFFAVAALGGLVLFVRHWKGLSLPKVLIAAHALMAIVGFVLVLLTALG